MLKTSGKRKNPSSSHEFHCRQSDVHMGNLSLAKYSLNFFQLTNIFNSFYCSARQLRFSSGKWMTHAKRQNQIYSLPLLHILSIDKVSHKTYRRAHFTYPGSTISWRSRKPRGTRITLQSNQFWCEVTEPHISTEIITYNCFQILY